MSCIIYPSPIFGPIYSRRLGISLGINLLPEGGKVCSFDCLYCECGFNKDHRSNTKLPSREKVKTELETRLHQLDSEGIKLDVLTFAGNGEPTSHPQFAEIIDDVIELRNAYCPSAKISVLSNSTFIIRPQVFNALLKVDNNILKLDTVDVNFIRLVDRPNSGYSLDRIIETLIAFKGHLTIQTMFLKGIFDGIELNNTTDQYVNPWLEVLEKIQPQSVMIYTIDRETPVKSLQKATKEELNQIRDKLIAKGFQVQVAY